MEELKDSKEFITLFEEYAKMDLNLHMDFDEAREFSYQLGKFINVCDPTFSAVADRPTFFKDLAHISSILSLCVKGLRSKKSIDVSDELEKLREKRPGNQTDIVDFMIKIITLFTKNLVKIIKGTNGVKVMTVLFHSCSFYSFYHKIQTHDAKKSLSPIGKLTTSYMNHSLYYTQAVNHLIAEFLKFNDLTFLMNSKGRELCTLIYVFVSNLRQINKDNLHHFTLKGIFKFKAGNSPLDHPMFTDPSVAAIFEVIFGGSTDLYQLEFFNKYFRYQMQALLDKEMGIYCLSSLIYHWKDKIMFQEMIEEALSAVALAFEREVIGRDVLISIIGSACHYHRIRVKEMKDTLYSLLGLDSPDFNPASHGPAVLYIACLTHFQSVKELIANERGLCLIKSFVRCDPELMKELSALNEKQLEVFSKSAEWVHVQSAMDHVKDLADKKRIKLADGKRRHNCWLVTNKVIQEKKKLKLAPMEEIPEPVTNDVMSMKIKKSETRRLVRDAPWKVLNK